MNNERRQSPYRPRLKAYKRIDWLDVLGAFAMALVAAWALSALFL